MYIFKKFFTYLLGLCCGVGASLVAYGACEILVPNEALNPHPLHWQADS